MKIFQYFLLLILMATVSLTVFIFTQSPSFEVEHQFTVDAPKEIVYEHINDLNLWSDWVDLKKEKDGNYTITFDEIGSFPIKEEYKYPYDSLTFDISNDETISNMFWSFERQGSKTNVTFILHGQLDLKTKLITFFQGKPSIVASTSTQKNINSLIVYFIKQYKDFNISIDGEKEIEDTNYIFISKKSTLGTLNIDIAKSYQEIQSFAQANHIEITGDPFLILKNNLEGKELNYDFALPIKDTIYLSENDLYSFNTLPKTLYLDAKLEGNYVHLDSAFHKIQEEINKKHLLKNTNKHTLIVLEQSMINTRFPAEWKTTLKTPIVKTFTPTEE